MKIIRTLFIAGSLLVPAALGMQAQQYGPPPPPPPQGYQPSWDAPPPEFAEMRQRGFRDGIQGARKDYENHRPPNVNNRDEYRHPGFIPGPDRREYKIGFRRGYDVGVQHIYGPPPGRPH